MPDKRRASTGFVCIDGQCERHAGGPTAYLQRVLSRGIHSFEMLRFDAVGDHHSSMYIALPAAGCTVPAALCASAAAQWQPVDSNVQYVCHAGTSPCQSFRFYRFNALAVHNEDANAVQLSEVALYSHNVRLPVASVRNPGGASPGREGPSMATDQNGATKWLDFNKGDLIIELSDDLVVTTYDWRTADDAPGRSPLYWSLEGSRDASGPWSPLHTHAKGRSSAAVQQLAGDTWQGPFGSACDQQDAVAEGGVLVTGSWPWTGNWTTVVDGVHAADALHASPVGMVASCFEQLHVTVDLGSVSEISSVVIWHRLGHRFCNQKLATSKTGRFRGEETVLFSTGLAYGAEETAAGLVHEVGAASLVGRYVRHWSSRNAVDFHVYFAEIAVNFHPRPHNSTATPQAATFGCVDHWTTSCTYDANQASLSGGDYSAALNAFTACAAAGSSGDDGYCHVELDRASGLSNQVACQSDVVTNIGFHTTIPFTVHIAGLYRFRMHADYGNGGFIGIDGTSYHPGDVFGHVLFDDVYLAEGEHYFESLGFDGCCDGRSELEVHLPCDRRSDPWRLVVSGESSSLSARDRGDNCTADQRLEGSIGCGQTVSGSTAADQQDSQHGSASPEHLFLFTLSETKTVQFDSCASTYDTWLRIYSQDLATEYASCDDCGSCGIQTVLSARLAPGTYTLVVEGFRDVAGEYSVTMNCGTGLHGAVQCGNAVTGDNQAGLSILGHGSAEHYYSFTAFVPGVYQFNSCQSDFDTVLRIYDRDVTREIAACDDCAGSCGVQAVLEAELPAGSYVLVVEGWTNRAGSYHVVMDCPLATSPADTAPIFFSMFSYQSRRVRPATLRRRRASYAVALANYFETPAKAAGYCTASLLAASELRNSFVCPGGAQTSVGVHLSSVVSVAQAGIYRFRLQVAWAGQGFVCVADRCTAHTVQPSENSTSIGSYIYVEQALLPGHHAFEALGFGGEGIVDVKVQLPELCAVASVSTCADVARDWLVADSAAAYQCAMPQTGASIGEVGTVSVDHNAITVYFQSAYVRPVVIAGVATGQSLDELAVRVKDVTRTSFSLYVQEAHCRDVTHEAEQVSWMVVEAGLWGGGFEAGSVVLDDTEWAHVPVHPAVQGSPVAVAQVMSHNSLAWMSSRVATLSADSFQLQLSTDTADAVVPEIVGWVAAVPGRQTLGGLNFEAGIAPSSAIGFHTTVRFGGGFRAAPSVFASVEFEGSMARANVRLSESSDSAFTYMVQEDGCADEWQSGDLVGLRWFAVDTGMIVPNITTACPVVRNASVHVPVGMTTDLHGATYTLSGNTSLDAAGFHFSADGDEVGFSAAGLQIRSAFSLSVWVRARRCASENQYSYLYSHVQNEELGIYSVANSNINVMMGCASSASGAYMRFVMVDSFRRIGFADRLLTDMPTNQWLHLVVTVDGGLNTYVNGDPIADRAYQFPVISSTARNVFNAQPSAAGSLGQFNLRPVFSLGGSAHRDPASAQFLGSMSEVIVMADALSLAEAQCIYRHNHVRTAELASTSGEQAATFGCVDHWTTSCTYDANQASLSGGDYSAALNAFTACAAAGSSGDDGYCHVELDRASGLSNQVACQSDVVTNIGFHTTIPFTVHIAGLYRFRMHADYGNGGFIGIDGTSYHPGDVFGHVLFDDVYLAEGEHYFESLGFDGCCDGRSELEVHLPCDRRSDPWRLVVSGESSSLIPRDGGSNCTADQRLEGSIGCGQTVSGTTGGSYSQFGGASAEHLISFTINETKTVQFDSCASTYDTFLRVYTADLQNEMAACDDCGPCGVQTVLSARLTPGMYVLIVEGYDQQEGDYSVTMNCGSGLHGSLQCGGAVTGNNQGGVSAVGHASMEHYYSFTAFVSGVYQFNSCQSQFDTVLYVYDRDVTTALAVCDDCTGSCSTRAVLQVQLDPGDYVLVVEGWHNRAGLYVVEMQCVDYEPEPFVIGCNMTVGGSTVGAISNMGTPAGQTSRWRDCHSAAPSSTFSRCFNVDGEGVSVK